MKIRVTVLVASIAAAVLAAPALAKGPSDAKISGPGIKGGGIHLKSAGGGDPSSGTPLGDLTEFGGYFAQVFGAGPASTQAKRPSGSLGPKYAVVYKVAGDTAELRQDLYPYAKPYPVSYMRSGQSLFGDMKTRGGWFVATPDLKSTLVKAGLPGNAPSSGGGSAWALSWGGVSTIVAAALLLLALTYLAYRRRPRALGV